MNGTEPALLGRPDLDDGAALVAADRQGLLRGTASAGAQVRATTTELAGAGLERLRGVGVRSVVLLATGGSAARAAQLVVAGAGSRVDVPLLHLPELPRWVGPLDVVVAATDDAGDLGLAASLAAAVRRGAEVVVVAPDAGPVAAAASGRGVLVPPRVPVPAGLECLRFVAAALAVVERVTGVAQVPLELLADELDRDAERNHPEADLFASPAKSLAARMQDHAVVLAADTPAALVVAEHAAEQLLLRTGRGAVAAQLRSVVAGAAQLRSVGAGDGFGAVGDVADPFFHDPLIDGALPAPPARVLLLADGDQDERLASRLASLPDVELVTPDVTLGSLAGQPLAGLLTVLARLETAAALLGLVTGTGRG